MTKEEILLQICADVMDIDISSISLDSTRDDIGEFDSLSIIQVIDEMEDRFGTPITKDVLDSVKIEKISDFLSLIEN